MAEDNLLGKYGKPTLRIFRSRVPESTQNGTCPLLVFSLEHTRQCRCNSPMILRLLLAWFWQPRPSPPQKAPEASSAGTAFDLNEFGRLLNSGKTEDLKTIARALSRRDTNPGNEPQGQFEVRDVKPRARDLP